MNRIALVAAIIILIGALVILNRGISKNALTDQDEEQQAQSAQSHQPKPPAPQAPSLSYKTADTLPPEETINDPSKAAEKITVGWAYDADSQVHPKPLMQTIAVIRRFAASHPATVSAEIVDLDVPAEELSAPAQAVTNLGVEVNGKPLPAGDPPGFSLTPAQLTQALNAAASAPHP